MLECGARHVEVAEDVGAEGEIELLVGDVLDRCLMLLEGGIVDENVEAPELFARLIHGAVAERGVGDITRNEQAPLAHALDRALRLFRIALFLGEIHDCDIRAFAREEVRHRPANPRVATRDECDLAIELAGRLVRRAFITWSRVDLSFDARVLLVLLRIWWCWL